MRGLKYIHARHMDYWYAVHGVGDYTQEDAEGLEFSITNDEKGRKCFFLLDLLNLPALERIIAEKDEKEKNEPGHELFLQRYQALKNGEIDFFIAWLCYPGKPCDFKKEGDGCLTLMDCKFNGKSVFKIRNKNGSKPDYAVIFVNEREALLPKKVVHMDGKIVRNAVSEKLQISVCQCTR